jgi:TctA family transporter
MGPEMLAMMGVNLGLSGAQTAYGIFQQQKAQNELKKLGARPEYKVQPEAYKQLGIAQGLASNRNLPGQQDMEAMIDAQTGNAVTDINRSGGSMADRMAAIAAAYAGGTTQKVGIGLQAQQQYLNNLQNLQQAYGQMVAEKDKVFESKQQNYDMKNAALQALLGAGIQNIGGGIQGMGGSINQGMSYQGQMKQQEQNQKDIMAQLALIHGK